MSINYLKELNDRQIEAVNTINGPILIIAGAGSGKTRTITFRIAHMLETGIPQNSILSLTFTNKAASEMAIRVTSLTRKKCTHLTISTFHSFGAKLLRSSIHHIGYKANFSIYDQSDKMALIKEVARELKFPREAVDAYALAHLFSDIKTGMRSWNSENDQYRELYAEYLDHLKTYNAVDFDDLIVLPIRLLRDTPEILQSYQDRFHYFMVDEFQDTSKLQYELIRLLAEKSKNLCVVGDDDQSIYSWRGADYGNILQFEHDFPGVIEIKLEQNYRSTETILSAANGLISHNRNRKHKNLWTGEKGGNALEVIFPENEEDEAHFIAEQIRSVKQTDGTPFHEVGVLVRTNSLTKTIETAFLKDNIPYKVSGGTSFFQRKEVKDIISYLRIMANPDDDVSFLRICNTPRRGIGKKTIRTLRSIAEEKGYSIYSALSAALHLEVSPFPTKVKTDLWDFVSVVEVYREKMLSGKPMAPSLKAMVEELGYWAYLVQETHGNERTAKFKYGNILAFTDILETYEGNPDTIDPNLFDFLNRITLITRDDNQESDENGRVNLMTIHSAKGLEFDIVFLPGVEENIIPHARAIEEDPKNIEEERRLFYVALTRARKKLYLSSCRTRKLLRNTIDCIPSPFLDELPQDLIKPYTEEKVVEEQDAMDFFSAIKSRFNDTSE